VSSSGNLGFCYGCGFNASWGYGGLQLSSNGTELSNNNQSVYAVGYAGIGYPQFIPASDNNIESIVQYSGGLQVTPKTTLQGKPPALFPTAISITFQPNYGLTLANAAALLGFTGFDWVQSLTVPSPSPYFGNNFPNGPVINETGTIRDPPANGGYTYQLVEGFPNGYFGYPFYYEYSQGLLNYEADNFTLPFFDSPADSCLVGGAHARGCLNSYDAPGSELVFQTSLVGVLKDFVPGTDCLADLTCEILATVNWTDTFNGTNGGISVTWSDTPVDPNTGTGGISILSVDDGTTAAPLPNTLIMMLGGLALLAYLAAGTRRENRPQPLHSSVAT